MGRKRKMNGSSSIKTQYRPSKNEKWLVLLMDLRFGRVRVQDVKPHSRFWAWLRKFDPDDYNMFKRELARQQHRPFVPYKG